MNYLSNILTPNGSFEVLSSLVLATAKATVLIAFAAFINLIFRRTSASTRHLLWTSALCAALFLPFLSFLSFWEMPILPVAPPENAVMSALEPNDSDASLKMPETPLTRELPNLNAASDSGEQQKAKFSATTNFPESFAPTELTATTFGRHASPEINAASALIGQSVKWILAVWLAGTMLLLFRLCAGLAASGFLARNGKKFKRAAVNELFTALCAELQLENEPRLRCSKRTTMPIVCGIFRSVVLLPASAEKWSEQRLRMVLLHELAHVARRDCLTQMLAQTACAIYWFNPLVWIAARRSRVEREQACDDRVLSIGTKPSEYAHHLLEIARSMQEERSIFRWSQTTSVAMARRSQLEGRLLSILRPENNFGAASRAASAGIVATMCFLLVPLAIIRPTAAKTQEFSVSEITGNDEKDETAMSLPNSLPLLTVSEQEEKTERQNTEIGKTIEKSAASDALHQSSAEFAAAAVEQNKKIEQSNSKFIIKENAPPNSLAAISQSDSTPLQIADITAPPAPEISSFVKAEYRQESVSPTQTKSGDFIDEMASVGFTNLSVNELIMLKTHRVTADFVRGLRALGFNNLTAKTVTNLRIYRVTPAYIEAMAALGYKNPTLKELTNARIYSVTPEYVKAIQNAGYPSLSLSGMMTFKIYGVTPEIVRSARSRLGDLTPKQIISLKIAGVLNGIQNKKKETK